MNSGIYGGSSQERIGSNSENGDQTILLSTGIAVTNFQPRYDTFNGERAIREVEEDR